MTDEELELLRTHAAESEVRPGWWRFSLGPLRTAEETLGIIRGCLILGTPVTDTITTEAWLTIISKVTELEEQVNLLKSGQLGA